jgi:exonuclease III
MDFPTDTVESDRCSSPTKRGYLCGKTTVSRGLCVDAPEQCNERSDAKRTVPTSPVNLVGAKYAYVEDNLGSHCYYPEEKLIVDYEIQYEDGEPVPENFSFLTYNIWGLARNENLRHLFSLRKDLLERTLRGTNADIMCFQEMSQFAFDQLTPFIDTYKFASEKPYPAPGTKSTAERNRVVDGFVLSRFKPSRIVMYALPGVLNYNNCMCLVEYPNLVIFNLYNQAGSRLSPGQENKWIHYSRCRYDILQTIYDLIKTRYIAQNVIICGDFNFDLDGSVEAWPEIAMLDLLKQMGFVDTYRQLNAGEHGFTEDTDTNYMRWNQKMIEKHFRYDAILYKEAHPGSKHWTPRTSALIGTESLCLTPEESVWFLDTMSEAKGGREAELRGCGQAPGGELLIPINASDHFGVLSTFVKSKAGGRRTRFRRSRVQRSTRKRRV